MRWLVLLIGFIFFVGGGLAAVGIYLSSPRDNLRKSDLIVAVSGGDTRARAEEAAKLYLEGWAPRILFSGAALDPESRSNADAMREIAVEVGVPPDMILVEEESYNTRENAVLSSQLVEALEHERIILVTSPYHQRRTYIEFRNELREDIDIVNHSAPDQRWSRRFWWRNSFGRNITVSEIPKVLYALNQSR